LFTVVMLFVFSLVAMWERCEEVREKVFEVLVEEEEDADEADEMSEVESSEGSSRA
jgi:hypothetical protein